MDITHSLSQKQALAQAYPRNTLRYDWLVALIGVLGTVGSYTDLWAHTHVPKLETFFTPWHAMLYSSFLIAAAVYVGTAIVNHQRGYAWMRSVPRGYGLALLGVFIYAAGGVGDMCWHILFGIEKNLEALLSPTHLCLALGGFLMRTGPLRSAWQLDRERSLRGWRALGPALLALFSIYSSFIFFTFYANAFSIPFAAFKLTSGNDMTQALGVVSIVFQTALLMGPLLLFVRRWQLPFGALTIIFALTGVLAGVPEGTYYLIPVLFLAGLGGDLLLWRLRPAQNAADFHIFAFVLPVLLYAFYFVELGLLTHISWSIHMWMGSIVLAGVAGLLLSYLARSSQQEGA